MSLPRYQTLLKEQIPTADLGRTEYASVIAGEFGDLKGPARTFTPVAVLDVRSNGRTTAELSLPVGHNSAYSAEGEVLVNSSQQLKATLNLPFSARLESVFIWI
jgi:quercetin 2,3-dioxygenase